MAKQCGQDIEDGHVGMTQFRDMPGKMKVADFNRRFLDDFTGSRLPGLLRQDHRRERPRAPLLISLPDLSDDLGFTDVAGNNIEYVIGSVFFLIIFQNIPWLEGLKNIRITNNSQTV